MTAETRHTRRMAFLTVAANPAAPSLWRRFWLAALVLLTFSGQTVALGQSRWVELNYDIFTITYDLTTVQMLDPGRFTIIQRWQDHPDVIRLELAVLTKLNDRLLRLEG